MSGQAALASALRIAPALRERAAHLDHTSSFPAQTLAQLHEAGLLRLLVPAEHGGLGCGPRELAACARVLAGACLPTALVWSMHCFQVDAIAAHASDALAADVLQRVATDGLYIASVTSEHGRSASLLSARTPLRENGTGVLIDRAAPTVTGALLAGGFLIAMRASESASEHEVSLVYADRTELEIEISEPWETLGMRGTASTGVRLRGTVPADHLVGGPGAFGQIARERMIPLAHLGWAACWLGAAQACLKEFVHWLRRPGRGGGPDPRSELVRERLGRIRIDLELVAACLDRVCDQILAARPDQHATSRPADQIRVNTLKVAASELAFRAVDRLVELGGLSLGYRRDSPLPLERHLRDLRSASLMFANDRLTAAIGALTLLDGDIGLN